MKAFHKTAILVYLFLFAASATGYGAIKLPPFFSDNMVLQQKTGALIWGTAKPGSTVLANPSWSSEKYAVKADAAGRWQLKVNTPAAGGPYQIVLSDGNAMTLKNILIGEVWLCTGQSNMEMPMKGFRDQPVLNSNAAIFNSENNQLRLYTLPRSAKLTPQDTSKPAVWQQAAPEGVANFSATAYYFGRLLQQRLNVPVGLVNISYGGSPAEAWMSGEALKAFGGIPLPLPADSLKANNKTATALYNAMLHPFIGYAIKGCLWYQGESNYDRPDQYEKLFPAMVSQWRKEFNQGDFPFYFCQIAPYNYAQLPPYNAGGKFNSAYLRDAQRKALKNIPNSGMVVLLDGGEENSIHPANKQMVGERFAYLTLGHTYGFKGFAFASPAFDTMTVNNGTATLKFSNSPNGFTSFGKPLQNFEIAGANKNWRPATAVISGGNILVASPEVKDPVAVRYAFRDFVVGTLFSTEGFPVSSFRTDDW